MRALELLTQQHREVESLFQKSLQAQGMEKVVALGSLAEALTVHTALEERFFYPFLQAEGLDERIDQLTEEHARALALVSDILQRKRHDPGLDDTVRRLEQVVRQHVAEEEAVVFPRVRAHARAEDVDRLGTQMEAAAQELRQLELLRLAERQELPAP
jgi:hemerythrin superfamily protein